MSQMTPAETFAAIPVAQTVTTYPAARCVISEVL